jgi:hypothetical protein
MPFLLGGNPDYGNNADRYVAHEVFDGLLREVRISRAVRYTGDFEPAMRFEPDDATIALYHCDEGEGDVLHNSSGNMRHGKIKGARWVKADQPVNVIPEPRPAVIDLLPLIDLKQDRVAGNWSFNGTRDLLSEGAQAARLRLPYRPPEEYDLHIVFTRTQWQEGVAPILVGGGRQFRCVVGGWGGKVVALDQVDGKLGDDNPTTVRKEAGWIQNGRPTDLVVQVRRDRVSVYLDTDLVTSLRTDFKNVDLLESYGLEDKTVLGLSSSFAPTTFHKVEVVEISGFGEYTRPKDEAAKKAAEARSAVWRPLFNGRNFDGWLLNGWGGVKAAEVFTITEREGQTVLCIRDGANTAMLTTGPTSYRNYQLHIEYQWGAASRDAQHQVLYHHQGAQATNSFEIQAAGASGAVRTSGNRAVQVGQFKDGAVVPVPGPIKSGVVYPLVKGVEKPLGEWNTLDLICVDGTALHLLNGKVVNVITDFRGSQEDKDAAVTSGIIGFHARKGELFLRRIDIRPITAIPPEFLK